MILGVDHIALSCDDIHRGADALRNFGYTISFMESNLPNNTAKQAILRDYEPTHALAYCRLPNAVAIELTQHSAEFASVGSFYQVLFANKPSQTSNGVAPSFAPQFWQFAQGLENSKFTVWDCFRSTIWHQSEEGSGGRIKSLAVPTTDFESSLKFWTAGLGCKLVEQGSSENVRWANLRIASPVQAWCLSILLIETATAAAEPCLDDPGFPCLALLTNELETDLQRALDAGGEKCGTHFETMVNDKSLRIALLRGPCGEPIELIEFKR
jgi:catechol 2,3-dioxygenase-like lactoylglutathione lyase family enzyme